MTDLYELPPRPYCHNNLYVVKDGQAVVYPRPKALDFWAGDAKDLPGPVPTEAQGERPLKCKACGSKWKEIFVSTGLWTGW